jgi:hypothetical protein
MVSANTLHVVATELAIGSIALSGLAFVVAGASATVANIRRKELLFGDQVAHMALLFGLVALPFAILTGINSSPGDGIDHPLLANKLSLATTGMGLGIGVLWCRLTQGRTVWGNKTSATVQSLAGVFAAACILLTASLGGTYARGESLLSWLPVSFDSLLLMPTWASVMVIVLATVLMAQSRTAPKVPLADVSGLD